VTTAGSRGHHQRAIEEHLRLVEGLGGALDGLETAGRHMIDCLEAGGKLLACGNGGSAADSQHFVAELVGRFERRRRGLAAVALTVDSSVLTAVGNDFGYEGVFERQLEALARPGDVLVAISTSGRSANVVAAANAAVRLEVAVIALVGAHAGELASANVVLSVPTSATPRVQEVHALMLHLLCDTIDRHFAADPGESSS
jgi:phosphoheptose isomerase